MIAERKQRTTIYVDRTTKQWIVLDPDGNYWVIPSVDNPWDQRQPYFPTEQTELEPVPGHYKHMLALPI